MKLARERRLDASLSKVYIISAPSGAGKTSLLKAFLVGKSRYFSKEISYTTRKPRNNEINAHHYHFIDEEVFKKMIYKKEFLEYAKVFGYYYGTSKKTIYPLIQKGVNVILEIDWQGARQAKRIFRDKCISIFILPPNLNTLYERLIKRDQDSQETIEARIKEAENEMSHQDEYDHIIVNSSFNEALKALEEYMYNT